MSNLSVHFSSKTDMWATPQAFFDRLNDEFKFTLDPCATAENKKCDKYFTEEEDGLKQSWAGHRVFMNPPYGRKIGFWIKKAFEEAGGGRTLLSLYFRLVLIRDIFINIFTAKPKLDLLKVA
jgi:phage N-6-adenine-methyltransferase